MLITLQPTWIVLYNSLLIILMHRTDLPRQNACVQFPDDSLVAHFNVFSEYSVLYSLIIIVFESGKIKVTL